MGFADEDAQAKERIDANDEKFKDAIGEDDKKVIEDKVNEVMSWLDTAEHAEKEEFESMQKELEGVCNPIIQKMYAASGGAPGPDMGAGFPGADGGAPAADPAGGPTIEEVD